MSEYLFRFRSIHALLDGHHELENQEIYFSPPEQLNDPLEGFKAIFWQGDAIVWTNLLRHYLLCLMQATYCYFFHGLSPRDDRHAFEATDRVLHWSWGSCRVDGR